MESTELKSANEPIICPNCGARLDKLTRYCPNCAAPLPQPAENAVHGYWDFYGAAEVNTENMQETVPQEGLKLYRWLQIAALVVFLACFIIGFAISAYEKAFHLPRALPVWCAGAIIAVLFLLASRITRKK